jgi:hypothetical protein
MPQNMEEKIQQVSEGLRGPMRICRELSAKHSGYVDLFIRSGVSGASIYGLWVFCDEDIEGLTHLLEACRHGQANLVHVATATRRESVRQRYGIDFDALIEYGRSLPSSKRLA